MNTYLKQAYWSAHFLSNDPDTQNGAVIISKNGLGIEGANVLTRGILQTKEHLERPAKYQFIEHAERAVIYNAIRAGISIKGATLYCPWFACPDCARAIVMSGIARVVGHKQMMDKTTSRWQSAIKVGNEILDAAGVIREYYDGQLFDSDFSILFDGKLWTP